MFAIAFPQRCHVFPQCFHTRILKISFCENDYFLYAYSWWTIVLHLCWSLLDQTGESDPMTSVDLTSVTLARILYAAFLILGVILLVNMLIALLSNTYQQTEVRDRVYCLKARYSVLSILEYLVSH